jgi:hypothetical protein
MPNNRRENNKESQMEDKPIKSVIKTDHVKNTQSFSSTEKWKMILTRRVHSDAPKGGA